MPVPEPPAGSRVQDAVELVPTFDWPEERLVLLMAGGEAALLRSVENAEDRDDLAAAAVAEHALGPADVLVGVAASGDHEVHRGGGAHGA